MSKDQPVLETPAVYYDSIPKKWLTGTFTLTEKLILFYQDSEKSINIPLNEISGLEKRQSSLIYPAVVVDVAAEKYWFASFSNRDSVFNLIELFWRDALLSKEHRTAPARSQSGSTDLAKDLLNLLHESENTLINAANSLSDQGKQIDETQGTVADINTDLNAAERLVKNMNFTRSLMQLTNTGNASQTQEPVKCFKITFTLSDNLDKNCLWIAGTLFLGETVSLVDESKVIHLNVKFPDIVSLQIVSSWKCHLIFSEDDCEKSCYIMCAKLARMLKYLSCHSSLSGRITYSENAERDVPSTSSNLTSYISDSRPSPPSRDAASPPISEQLQDSLISDDDLQEISSMLANLQGLASEVSREQLAQMEKITTLTTDVEKTELRIKANTKEIKKLI